MKGLVGSASQATVNLQLTVHHLVSTEGRKKGGEA